MLLIERLFERLKRHPQRVVFPEGSDSRILQAAQKFADQRLGIPVLVGKRAEIEAHAAEMMFDKGWVHAAAIPYVADDTSTMKYDLLSD